METAEVYSPGLEGILAGETAISTVEGGLRYPGLSRNGAGGECEF